METTETRTPSLLVASLNAMTVAAELLNDPTSIVLTKQAKAAFARGWHDLAEELLIEASGHIVRAEALAR